MIEDPQAATAAGGPAARILACWAWGGLVALFLVLSLTPITNNDVWLHLANGRYIVEKGEVPLADPYSFSAAGHRFHAHEWLAGVFFFLVHRASGVPGLILFKTAVLGSAFALAGLAARALGAGPVAVAASLLPALIALNHRFLERPEIFTLLLTALYLLVLVKEHDRLMVLPGEGGAPGSPMANRFGLWLLVPAQWLWAQLHGYFLTGLALVGAFLAAESLQQAWLARRAGRLGRWRRLVAGWGALTAMGLVGLANPNGLDSYLFPFRLAGGANLFMEKIHEWRPPFTSDEVTHYSFFLAFCLWLALLVLGAAVGREALGARPWAWRGMALGGLVALVGIRLLMAAQVRLPQAFETFTADGVVPVARQWSTGLARSAWLWSPAELVGSISGRPAVQAVLHAALSPLRWIGPWADDLFSLLWVGLAALTVACWRRPAPAALATATVMLTFVFLLAGEWAVPLLAVTVVPALASGVIRRRLAFWQAATVLLFLAMAVRQNRNTANFVVVTLPLLAMLLGRLAKAAAGHRNLRRAALAAIGLIAFGLSGLAFWAGWPYTPQVLKHPGLGVGPQVPAGAVGYLREQGIGGNAFNKYADGAYLIYQLFPETRVFMDSRNGVYGEELFGLYGQTLRDPRVAAATFDRYPFDYVLLDYEFYPAHSDDQGLLTYLRSQPGWVLVYFDDRFLVYLPNRPGNADLIARDGYRRLDPAGFRPGSFAGSSAAVLREIDEETRRALARQPKDRSARLLRAEALLTAGKARQAWRLFESVIEDEPADLYSRVAAGRLAARFGETERAVEHFRFVLALRPGYKEVREELRRLESAHRAGELR